MRLDQLLVDTGKADSRARAQALVKEGNVRINGDLASKPSQKVSHQDDIEISGGNSFVSRAAHKLIRAIDAFEIVVAGKTCLDLGASTGGFTQVLLKEKAAKVYAVDVGHGQLHPKVAGNPKVLNVERTHAKDLSTKIISDEIDLLVCDVSFISLTKALPPAMALCRSSAVLAALIKPQFEVGKENIGRGGIVSLDESEVKAFIIAEIMPMFHREGWFASDIIASPIKGGDGNKEYLVSARKV